MGRFVAIHFTIVGQQQLPLSLDAPAEEQRRFRFLDVRDVVGEAFPELKRDPQDIADTIKAEEEAFGLTLDRGISLFNEAITKVGTTTAGVFPGDVAFDLVSTFGFPLD